MKPKTYIETSVISYLTALPSRDLVIAAQQQMTMDWWASREAFDLFVSEFVLEEAGRGDVVAAGRRLGGLGGLPLLEVTAASKPQSFVHRWSLRRSKHADTKPDH